MGIEGTYLNIVKAIYNKPTANIIFNGEKWKAFPLRFPPRNKTRMSTFTTIIQHISGSLSYSIQKRKRNKRNPDQKRSKALTAGDIILYIGKPKDCIRKVLERISEFSKVAGYKINAQKSLTSLYILTMKNQKEQLRNQPHSPLQQKELNI